jgi:hypothetical protein
MREGRTMARSGAALLVMPGLVPGIHVFLSLVAKT